MKSFITKTIVIVSVVSFLTDIASEMLYPVMPLYLQSIGYGVLAIGLIEGFSELVAGINKVFFGRISDVTGRRKVFIVIGYAVSALAKPAIGFLHSVGGIFAAKFADRLGKGVRTAPRDALLVSESTPSNRGKVFGFHRSIDTLGAIIGPFLGLLILIAYPGNYKLVFAVSIIPGLIAVAATLLLPKDKNTTQGKREKTEEGDISPTMPVEKAPEKQTFRGLISFWRESDGNYKKLLLGFLLFSLINSSNMFLLLRVSELGFSPVVVLVAYLVFNVVSASLSYVFGRIADKKGFRPVFIFGLLAFATSYAILGYGTNSSFVVFAAFALYGIFGATEEGMAKAWLSLYIPKAYKATGISFYLLANSTGFLVASVGTALLWQKAGSALVLSFIAAASILVMVYFLQLRIKTDFKENNLKL